LGVDSDFFFFVVPLNEMGIDYINEQRNNDYAPEGIVQKTQKGLQGAANIKSTKKTTKTRPRFTPWT